MVCALNFNPNFAWWDLGKAWHMSKQRELPVRIKR
jgi:hypothetical protein